MRFSRRESGFTLVELLVVIAIYRHFGGIASSRSASGA